MWKKNIVEFPRLLTIGSISNGFVSWLFGATGPLLIVLQAATTGHLPGSAVTSWIFAIYGVGGLLTLILSFYYRQPIGYAFSIPGAILVGASLAHHSFSQVVGAYLVTGIVIFVLGLSGMIDKLMKVLPMPVMMGMVSGVLLPFGTSMFHSVLGNPLLNGIPLLVFLILSFFTKLSKKFPPILGAILAAIVLLKVLPGMHVHGITFSVAVPHVILPSFQFSVMGELVLPLVLTVIAIQNAQGIAVLENADYVPPINSMTSWSGIGSILNAFLGGHSACIAGPMTALLASKDSGAKENRYAAAIVLGVLSILLAVFAPMAAEVPNLIPSSLIQMLGGLAMINVLIDSLKMSFSTRFKTGALFSFLITISGISIFHIGAPFWGLVGGTLATLFLDRADLKTPKPDQEKVVKSKTEKTKQVGTFDHFVQAAAAAEIESNPFSGVKRHKQSADDEFRKALKGFLKKSPHEKDDGIIKDAEYRNSLKRFKEKDDKGYREPLNKFQKNHRISQLEIERNNEFNFQSGEGVKG